MTKKKRNTLLLIPTIMLSIVYGASLVNVLCTHEIPYRTHIIVFSILSLIIDF
jgi:hypothetical protein